MAAAQASATMTSYGIDFINEDNARGILLPLFEQITHPAGADAYEHLHEIRAGNRKERHVCFARDRPRQQGLARARGTDQQHTLRDPSAQLLELLRLAQEFDNLPQLFLGLVHARHVLEGDLLLLHGQQARSALPERQRLVPARLHLADHEEPQSAQQDQRSPGSEQLDGPAPVGHIPNGDIHALVPQRLDHVRIVRRDRGVEAGVIISILAANLHAQDSDIFYVPLVHIRHEFREVAFLLLLPGVAGFHYLPEQQSGNADHEPEHHRFYRRIHLKLLRNNALFPKPNWETSLRLDASYRVWIG